MGEKNNTTPPRFPWCSQIVKGTICSTDLGLIVAGDVNLSNMGLTKIPYKFREVSGHFDISGNCLATFDNCPETAGSFDCSDNPYLSDAGNLLPKKLTGKGDNLFHARNNRSLAISLSDPKSEVENLWKIAKTNNFDDIFSGVDQNSLKDLREKWSYYQLAKKLPELEGIF